MGSRLRILYLAPCWPTGRVYGAKLRTQQIGTALRELGSVDFVVIKARNDDDGMFDGRPDHSFQVLRYLELRPLPRRSLLGRARCGLDPKFLAYYGWTVEESQRQLVLEGMRGYDLVWVYNLRTANLMGQWKWPRSVLDVDDIPSAVLRTQTETGDGLMRRLRIRARIPVARWRERMLRERFTTLCVSSEADRDYLGPQQSAHVIPNGFCTPTSDPPRDIARPPRIGFIGIFDYAPNLDGVRWFISESWPRIRREFPDARLRLIGKGSERQWTDRDNGIDGLGWVDDPSSEIGTWSAMIVPLRMGGGTRVKIAEAFSRKCPIVSTSFGAYGYHVTDGRELLLADSSAAFAQACALTIRDPGMAAAMAERAWCQFLDRWTWDAIAPRVWNASEACLRASRESSQPRRDRAAGIEIDRLE